MLVKEQIWIKNNVLQQEQFGSDLPWKTRAPNLNDLFFFTANSFIQVYSFPPLESMSLV